MEKKQSIQIIFAYNLILTIAIFYIFIKISGRENVESWRLISCGLGFITFLIFTVLAYLELKKLN